MGGFAGVVEGVFKEGLGKTLSTDAGEKLWEFTGNKSDIATLHPNAAAVMDMDTQMIAQRNAIFNKLDDPAKKLWAGISKDSDLMNAHDYKTATIRDVHSTLVQKGHPLQQYSDQILKQNVNKQGVSQNATHTFQTLAFQNDLQAKRMAADKIFGPQMQNVIPYIQELYESKQPQDKATADLLIRVVGNDSRDTAESGGNQVSRGALSIRRAFAKENKIRAQYGGTPLPLPKTGATYTPQSSTERYLQSFMVNRLASLAALPHIPMFGNLMSSPMSAIIKGFTTLGDSDIKAMSTASGILAKTQHSMFLNDLAGRTGLSAKVIGPGPAVFFYKMFHMPLFNTIRFHQLSLAASVGYHSAVMWAADAMNGDRRAIAELAEMKLSVPDIIKQGGKLNEEQMKQAMFHYVNNRMFIDRPMDRALRSNQNPFMRSATMFHGTIMSQFEFMRRETWKMVKVGDVKGLAQFAGTLGILFPIVIPWLDAAETFGRTASISDAKQAKDKDYQGLLHPKDAGDFTRTYTDMLSYLGGFGLFHSLMKSAWGDRLAATAMGPIPGSVFTTGQDIINAATKPTASGKHNWNPVGRDLSEFSVPIIGKWAGHKLFPTLAEQRANQIPKPQHGRRRRLQ
jgi:hypothetical protein